MAEDIDGTFSVSDDNVLMYHKAQPSVGRQLTWYDRSGKAVGTVGEAGEYGSVELSPSGDRAAVDIWTNGNRDVWVMDLGRAVMSRLTFERPSTGRRRGLRTAPAIAYGSNTGDVGQTRIYVKAASGVGTPAAIVGDDGGAVPITWLQRDDQIMFARLKAEGPRVRHVGAAGGRRQADDGARHAVRQAERRAVS